MRTSSINGILRPGSDNAVGSGTTTLPSSSLQPPLVRRIWAAALLAVVTLLVTNGSVVQAQSTIAVVTDPDGVNLRGGPGTNFVSLAVLPKGSELQVLGAKVNAEWLPVSFQGRIGFVDEDFVEVRSGPAIAVRTSVLAVPSPVVAPVPNLPLSTALTTMRVISPEGVNLRAAPGTDQRVLTVIPYSTRVQVGARSSDGRWVAVTYNGLSGWVNGQYLVSADDLATPEPPAVAGRYVWPVAGRSITTYFGGGHAGIDIDQYPSGGNPVVAIAAGRVTFAGGNPCCSYGINVRIDHGNGLTTISAHMMSADVREGDEVRQGQPIGKSGNTGNSTGAHLHLEVRQNGVLIDPLSLLPR